jgi:two-component system LytT family sensor kinase
MVRLGTYCVRSNVPGNFNAHPAVWLSNMTTIPSLEASENLSFKPERPLWGLSRFWWLVLFFWLVVSLASGLETSLLHMVNPREVLLETGLRLMSWVFMTLLVIWISSSYTLDRANWKRTIWVYVAACFLSLGVLGVLSFFGPPPFVARAAETPRSLTFAIMLRLTYQLPTFWGLVAVAHSVRLYEREHFRVLRETELRARLIQSRLQALQLQLNPHFLFNTLNSIAALVHDQPGTAERMIEALSNLLRLALASSIRQQVTVREELHFLEQYLLIERIRFGDRLRVEVQADEAIMPDQVPVLILQPLVENAVKHGVEARLGPGLVQIFMQPTRAGDFLRLEVINSGPVFKDPDSKIKENVGLTNTRARLGEMFGSRASLELHPRPDGGFVARILLPRSPAPAGRTRSESVATS